MDCAVSFFGRTILDEQTGAVFMNWSGSGFEVVFEATRLDVEFLALETVYPTEGALWPCVSVFLDEQETPALELLLDQPSQRCTLFRNETLQKHRIRVVKRTENDKGKVGLFGIEVEGTLLPMEPSGRNTRLEFIGDSITCGFGNEAKTREGVFRSGEQNGLKSYSAVAARLLNADYHNISISGISLCTPLDPDFSLEVPGAAGLRVTIKAMEDYYAYTDRLHEEACGKANCFSKWDFSRFRPDAIIINLGTNDSYRIKAATDKFAEVAHFERRYAAFIRKIRELNGSAPVICCTLGPMDYYLYDNIVEAVRKYKQETSDARVFCYKFGGIYPIEEGFGAGDHPSVKTHRRMGLEMSAQLKPWLRDADGEGNREQA